MTGADLPIYLMWGGLILLWLVVLWSMVVRWNRPAKNFQPEAWMKGKANDRRTDH